jgi:hypothetical protein
MSDADTCRVAKSLAARTTSTWSGAGYGFWVWLECVTVSPDESSYAIIAGQLTLQLRCYASSS